MGDINKCKMYQAGLTLSCRPCPHTANCNCGDEIYSNCLKCGGGLIGPKALASRICMACDPNHSKTKPEHTEQTVDEIVDQISEGYGNTPTIVHHAGAILKSYLMGTPKEPMEIPERESLTPTINQYAADNTDTETSNMKDWLKRTEN